MSEDKCLFKVKIRPEKESLIERINDKFQATITKDTIFDVIYTAVSRWSNETYYHLRTGKEINKDGYFESCFIKVIHETIEVEGETYN